MNNDDLLTTSAVAKYCHCTPSSVVRWIQEGKLIAYSTPGGQYRLDRESLLRFMREHNMYIPKAFRKMAAFRIAVVDDESELCDLVGQILTTEEGEYNVKTATNGIGGCLLIGEFKPHLVILDLMMPGLDGFEVCQRICAHETEVRPKILVLTAYAKQQNIDKILKSGADDWMTKPVEKEALIAKVEQLLADVEVRP
ncbi:response regulator [Candidatus Hydrogenedentota bacterium]